MQSVQDATVSADRKHKVYSTKTLAPHRRFIYVQQSVEISAILMKSPLAMEYKSSHALFALNLIFLWQ